MQLHIIYASERALGPEKGLTLKKEGPQEGPPGPQGAQGRARGLRLGTPRPTHNQNTFEHTGTGRPHGIRQCTPRRRRTEEKEGRGRRAGEGSRRRRSRSKKHEEKEEQSAGAAAVW